MEEILKEDDILKTFPEKEQKRVKEYRLVLEAKNKFEEEIEYKLHCGRNLRKKGRTYKEIAKVLNISKSTAEEWIKNRVKPRIGLRKLSNLLNIGENRINNWIYAKNKFNNKPIPRSLHTTDILRKKKLLPLDFKNKEKMKWLARTCGFLFGDGHLDKKLEKFGFSGDISDLKAINKEFLKYLKEEGKIYIKNKSSFIEGRKISGTTNDLWFVNGPISRVFYALGVPKGNKTKTDFHFPGWVKKDKSTLSEFCRALLWAELTTPKIRVGTSYGFVGFFMKKKNFVEEHIEFLKEFKSALGLFGIETSKIRQNKEDSYGFNVKNSSLNMLKLHEELPPLYCNNKKIIFDNSINLLKNKLKIKSYEGLLNKHLERVKQYRQVMKLRYETGFCDSKISKITGVPRSLITGWIYEGAKPYFVNRRV